MLPPDDELPPKPPVPPPAPPTRSLLERLFKR